MDKTNSSSPLLPQLVALTLTALLVGFASQAVNQPAHLTVDHDLKISLQPAEAGKSSMLPVYGTIGEFSLLERNGQPFSSQDLSGIIWVADFIYTSCTTECPLMTATMAHLQQELNAQTKVRLVSFSVDPETDTPQKLSEYAARFQARPEFWKFLTGPRETLYQLAQKDFHLPVQALLNPSERHKNHLSHGSEKPAPEKSPQPFLHSQKFVLIDGQMQIRGYYDSTRPEEMERLLKTDIPRLLHPS